MKILAFAEQRNGKLKSGAFEAVSTAGKLAGAPADAAAVVIGSGVAGLADELKGYGVDKVYVVDDAAFEHYNCPNYAQALNQAIASFSPDLVLGGASPMGKDLLPRVAAKQNAALVTDVTELNIDGSSLKAVKPMYAGKVLASLEASGSGLKMASLRPNVFAAENSGAGSATAEALSVSPDHGINLTTKEIRKGASEKPDLTEAALIISGGRALASADNFKILNECADVIGATVGASRAAVDEGFASHDMQVGQTGKTVNPNLYIACGISGSIQHMAGMRTAKTIVAINTAPDAPIFKIADYGIVADLFEAVPILTEKFKALLS